ncbi:DUF885 family protein [Desulfospira joergensenii]|uniref:DUF885 family protein n=1 Tax=Desulfospira joergensenii TaxID=53329 RepID=UPI0003FC4A6A|nr:DUF885 family protein [Desulfospira joergensenii]
MLKNSAEDIGLQIHEAIARNFPIASASDEFFYFPQVKAREPDWGTWDRFSPEFISGFVKRLSSWEGELDGLSTDSPLLIPGENLEIRVLKNRVQTLGEQLDIIRTWETQPSFYLTLTCLGLSNALESGRSEAGQRARALPQFLDQAARNLKDVPELYRDLAMEMIPDTRDYLYMLLPELPELSPSLEALDRFGECLKNLKVRPGFILPREKLDRIIDTHINSGMGIQEVNGELDLEIQAVNRGLKKEARKMGMKDWQEGYESIPLPKAGEEGLLGIFRDEVQNLGLHCRSSGLVSDRIFQANPVRVMPVPGYLSAVRAASSYSISPGHPPSGGVFYVIDAHDPDEAKRGYNREYRILAAHETWPGHHLLDISRWNLASPVLRALEQPIFYEGWACFAEELLWLTDYTQEPRDRLMLLKRRLWRAVRGKVDLGLQTGAMETDEAAEYLTRTGMGRSQARSSARKYLLNPGYQLCYTLGLRRFLSLFDRYGENDPIQFSRNILSRGEIGFKELESLLKPHFTANGESNQ